MLRMYFLQQWYSLSDEALEDALYDSQAMRDFVGIDLAREQVPSEGVRGRPLQAPYATLIWGAWERSLYLPLPMSGPSPSTRSRSSLLCSSCICPYSEVFPLPCPDPGPCL
jgi:Transposase domain (DUF772)